VTDDRTPEQQLGDLAARALDGLEGRRIVGAVLMLATESANVEDAYESCHYTLEGQHWITTLGIVTDWQRTDNASLVASFFNADEDDE
jgi:hypothetical protein